MNNQMQYPNFPFPNQSHFQNEPSIIENINIKINNLEREVKRLERRILSIEKNLMPNQYNDIKPIPMGMKNLDYGNDNYII